MHLQSVDTSSTASWDGTLRLWAAPSGRLLATLDGHTGLIMGVANDHSIAWGIARTLSAHGPNSPLPIRERRSDAA